MQQPNARERLHLAESLQADAVEAFARISAKTRGDIDSESALAWAKSMLKENNALELKLTRFETDDVETELQIRLLGGAALSSSETLLVNTKRTQPDKVTTATYTVRSDTARGLSEFSYQSTSTDETEADYPKQEMPGGAVEALTHELQQHAGN